MDSQQAHDLRLLVKLASQRDLPLAQHLRLQNGTEPSEALSPFNETLF